jgi:hypothetical protein
MDMSDHIHAPAALPPVPNEQNSGFIPERIGTITGRAIRGPSGKYSAILNISRTGKVAFMKLGSQSEETLLCILEQSLSHWASQSAVRRRQPSLCTVWPSHSQISSFSAAILVSGKARSRRGPNLGCMGADRTRWYDALPKKKPARQL